MLLDTDVFSTTETKIKGRAFLTGTKQITYPKSVAWGKTPDVVTGTYMVVSHHVMSLGQGAE